MNMRPFLLICFLICSLGLQAQSSKEKFAEAFASNNISMLENLANKNVNLYSNFAYTYYQLLLTSLPKNSVLITNSVDDTYPISILQITKNIRTDVKVITLALISDSLYLKQINKQYKTNLINGDNQKNVKELQAKVKRVYISTTVNSNLWFTSSNYILGLAVQRGNASQLKNLIDFYVNYQKLKLKTYSYASSDLLIIRNILPPLITLYKIDSSIPNLKSHILELAQMVKKAEQVKKILVTE